MRTLFIASVKQVKQLESITMDDSCLQSLIKRVPFEQVKHFLLIWMLLRFGSPLKEQPRESWKQHLPITISRNAFSEEKSIASLLFHPV